MQFTSPYLDWVSQIQSHHVVFGSSAHLQFTFAIFKLPFQPPRLAETVQAITDVKSSPAHVMKQHPQGIRVITSAVNHDRESELYVLIKSLAGDIVLNIQGTMQSNIYECKQTWSLEISVPVKPCRC